MPRAAPAVGTQRSATANAASTTRNRLDTRRLSFLDRPVRVEHPAQTLLELDRGRPAEHLLRAGDVGLAHLRVVEHLAGLQHRRVGHVLVLQALLPLGARPRQEGLGELVAQRRVVADTVTPVGEARIGGDVLAFQRVEQALPEFRLVGQVDRDDAAVLAAERIGLRRAHARQRADVEAEALVVDEAVGREEIEKEFAGTFKDLKDAKLEIDVKAIKFLSPNVAVESGTARTVCPKEEPDVSTYSALFVKRDGKWLLDRVTEEEPPAPATPPPSNYEHLKDLEWMVGSWIDNDEDDDATIQTDCNWAKNKNFMHRSFAVVIGDQVNMAGMQIIGWDPAAKQIRSWVFDSDGGFAEGKWTRKGNRWLIQQTGTLADGTKSSAVNIMKQIDNDSFTWQSVQRSVNGDILPNVDEVTVVRKPANGQTASSP